MKISKRELEQRIVDTFYPQEGSSVEIGSITPGEKSEITYAYLVDGVYQSTHDCLLNKKGEIEQLQGVLDIN